MGNNANGFCNCENNDSKFETSFRTSPNQNNNNQSSERMLCPFIHTVIYQNYTIDNNNNNINATKNKRQRNKNNNEKKYTRNDNNIYEMNFEYHSIKSNKNSLKNKNKGLFNLNPINDDIIEDKKSSKSNQINVIYNQEIIDNHSNNEQNENENYDNNKEKEENTEIKNINTKSDHIETNPKNKNSKSNNYTDNSYNSDAPTTNLDKPTKAPTTISGVDIQYLGKNTYYLGNIQYGTREGVGKMITGSNLYTGEFSNDQANGYGIYKKNGGELIYEGYWLNDEQNKYGIEKWNDGSIYFGEYSNQNKNGLGVYIWKEGTRYEGEFKNNMFNGYGIYFYNKNKIYSGQWKNNKKHGYGEYILKDKLYIGFYNLDSREGFGINYFKEENKLYIGFWKNNKRCGFGKIYNEKKMKYGLWSTEENKKPQWFKNDSDAIDYLKKNGLYDKYKTYFECNKDELINSFNDYYKNDFILPCDISQIITK